MARTFKTQTEAQSIARVIAGIIYKRQMNFSTATRTPGKRAGKLVIRLPITGSPSSVHRRRSQRSNS
jgi:hypothetical protein